MDYNLGETEWQCQGCDASAPPTHSDYMKLLRHQKGHHIQLVNIKTGEVLAKSVKQALSIGIDIPSDGKHPGKTSGKPEGTPELGMELTEEGITFPVTLPPVAFTLFDAAKAAKLVEDEDMDIDHWIFECIQKRFELDYELELMLVLQPLR